jgi:hypothetical protein
VRRIVVTDIARKCAHEASLRAAAIGAPALRNLRKSPPPNRQRAVRCASGQWRLDAQHSLPIRNGISTTTYTSASATTHNIYDPSIRLHELSTAQWTLSDDLRLQDPRAVVAIVEFLEAGH